MTVKRILSAVLGTCLLIGALALTSCKLLVYEKDDGKTTAPARRAEDETFVMTGAFAYQLNADGKSYTLTSYSGGDAQIFVSGTNNGLPVTKIGTNAFKGNTSLKIVMISDSILEIGNNAFEDCTSLVHFYTSDKLVSIGDAAFQNCSALTAMTIPDTVTRVGSYAFDGCASLGSVNIPYGLASVADYVFSGCVKLTSITIPDSVLKIETMAFGDCTCITNISIPDSVQEIEPLAFYGCVELSEVSYAGTIAQWNLVSKGEDWNTSTGFYTVHCIDGDIMK